MQRKVKTERKLLRHTKEIKTKTVCTMYFDSLLAPYDAFLPLNWPLQFCLFWFCNTKSKSPLQHKVDINTNLTYFVL